MQLHAPVKLLSWTSTRYFSSVLSLWTRNRNGSPSTFVTAFPVLGDGFFGSLLERLSTGEERVEFVRIMQSFVYVKCSCFHKIR